jgi:transposase
MWEVISSGPAWIALPLQQQNMQLEQQVEELTKKLDWYKEQFRLLQQKRFGTSSEKTHPDQLELSLFNEA